MRKGFSHKDWENGHLRNVEGYVGAVDRLYNKAIADISRLALKLKIDPEKPFSFKDYPTIKARADKLVQDLAKNMNQIVTIGAREQWAYANRKSDAFLQSIMNTSKIRKSVLNRMQDHNLEALKAFQARKVNGMNLSQRIWQYSNQFKESMELGIDVGIGAGKSAQKLSRELRGFLLEPNNLFRRVRDKRGNLVLSKAAKSFHPGQGVYRSSYKNAMRLTRSEINMSYRTADDLRWNQLNFVAGFEVKLSNNHTLNGAPFHDICDELAGKYPKQFRFVGWHPQCRCYKTAILQDPDEFNTDELNELKAAINGEEYKKYSPSNTITDMPANFKTWTAANQAKVDGYKSTPYFIKDNFKHGKIRNGLKADFKAVEPIPAKVVPSVPPDSKTSPKSTPISQTEAVYEKIVKVEDEIRMNRGFETAYATNSKGAVMLDKRGQATSVSFTQSEVVRLKDTIFTHNHPRGWKAPADSMRRIGNSFSPADILTAITADVAEMRAVTPNFTFVMKRPVNGWGISPTKAKAEINKLHNKIVKEFQARIQDGTTTVEKASIIHYHRLWTEFCQKFGIEYAKAKTR